MLISNFLTSRIPALVLGLLVLANSNAKAQTNAVNASHSPTYLHDIQPLFLGKCVRCHNEEGRFLPNWSDYKTAYADRVEIKRRVWDSWKGNYFKQPMPAGNCPECQTITEADRALIRDWVNSGAALGIVSASSVAKSKEERIQFGKRLFTTMCATCHQVAGQGVTAKYPPLAGSDFLNADKQQAIRILLHGRQGEMVVNGQKYNNTMPAFPLSDEDIANALTYTYNSFGNSGKEVTPDDVKALRSEKVQTETPSKTPASQFE
jgi:mono/diheme cytochrome c family protein